MEELSKHGKIGLGSIRAGMDRKTGAKYRDAGKLPSEMKAPRTWRTRNDPFAEDWPWVVERLTAAPELDAKTLFEHLMNERPGRYQEGQLRTLQRHVKQWRAQSGPDKAVFFQQEHRPGEAMQTDFTWATELEITIAGEPLPHMLCHPVLPYSNWEWATICRTESMAAMKRGVQAALFRLGRVPRFHQTDNSTAATHDLSTGKRGFNDEYKAMMEHLGMEPRTIEIGEKEQNGDVEALHRALKHRMKQHLLMRGHRDFESVAAYEDWITGVLEKANALRSERVTEELAAMKPLKASRLPEYKEITVTVTSWSTIRVKNNTYSVPSRLIGENVRVQIYDGRLEVRYGGTTQLEVERLLGRNGHRINYRHIIWSLVQKPGAFALYKYREDLFPTLTFRRAYDAIMTVKTGVEADLEYLRILHLAASTMESAVEAALLAALDGGRVPTIEQVRAEVAPETPVVPELASPIVDLESYDNLLESREEVAS
jgi:hypothetical protein